MVARTTRSLHVLDTLALAMRVLAVGSAVLHGEDGTSNYKSTATPRTQHKQPPDTGERSSCRTWSRRHRCKKQRGTDSIEGPAV